MYWCTAGSFVIVIPIAMPVVGMPSLDFNTCSRYSILRL